MARLALRGMEGQRSGATVFPTSTPIRTAVQPIQIPASNSPANSELSFSVKPFIKTSTGATQINFDVMNNSSWEARNLRGNLILADGNSTQVYTDTIAANQVAPKDVWSTGFKSVPPTMRWELYSAWIEWRWHKDGQYSDWKSVSAAIPPAVANPLPVQESVAILTAKESLSADTHCVRYTVPGVSSDSASLLRVCYQLSKSPDTFIPLKPGEPYPLTGMFELPCLRDAKIGFPLPGSCQ